MGVSASRRDGDEPEKKQFGNHRRFRLYYKRNGHERACKKTDRTLQGPLCAVFGLSAKRGCAEKRLCTYEMTIYDNDIYIYVCVYSSVAAGAVGLRSDISRETTTVCGRRCPGNERRSPSYIILGRGELRILSGTTYEIGCRCRRSCRAVINGTRPVVKYDERDALSARKLRRTRVCSCLGDERRWKTNRDASFFPIYSVYCIREWGVLWGEGRRTRVALLLIGE